MDIINNGGSININNNGGNIGDGNTLNQGGQPPGFPIVWRTGAKRLHGLTYRQMMLTGGVGFAGMLFNVGSSIFNLFGTAASIDSAYRAPWVYLICLFLIMIGFIGFMLRRNKVVQLPLLTLERSKSGEIYSARYAGTCGRCGGKLHHLRFASKDNRTYFECENNSMEHRGALDLSTLPDIEEDAP